MPRSVLLALLLLGCAGSSPTGPEPRGEVPFQSVVKATVPNRAVPQIRQAVREAATWREVWDEIWGAGGPALPAIDFGREMAIVVSAAEICFGDVTIESIVNDGELVVRLAEAAPSSCLCAIPETTFHAVRLPRIERTPRFEVRTTPPRCPS